MDSSRNRSSETVSARAARALPIPSTTQPNRRRSPDAARAVLTAAVELLDDRRIGYRGLTMQAVAARAGVSKATLYRWWPDKAHLVLDAYRAKSARDATSPITGDLRTDLLSHLGHLAFALTKLGFGPTVTQFIVAAEDESFGRLYRETLLRERRQDVLDILVAGQRSGQVRAGADLTVAVDAAYGAIHHRLLLTKAPIDGPFVRALADLLIAGVSVPGKI